MHALFLAAFRACSRHGRRRHFVILIKHWLRLLSCERAIHVNHLAHGQQLLFGVLQVYGVIFLQLVTIMKQACEDMRQLHLVQVDAVIVLVDEELLRELNKCVRLPFEIVQVKYGTATLRQSELLQEFLL